MARHLCSQASVRSTTQRRALRRLRPRLSSFSSPIRRMCVIYPASSAASSPVGLSYPLSRQRCCSTSSGSGRSTTMESMVASRSLQSCRFAPSSTAAKGPPSASTKILFFVPSFPRSVGLGPIFSPAEPGLVGASVGGLPCPIKAAEFVAFGNKLFPDALEKTLFHPLLEPVMNTTVIAKFLRYVIPLATRTHPKDDRLEHTTKVHSTPAAHSSRRTEFIEYRSDALPQGIGDNPNRRHCFSFLNHRISPWNQRQTLSGKVDGFKRVISR